MLTRFVTKGTIAGILSVAALYLSLIGHENLAETLRDPAFTQNLFTLISAALALYAGFAQGVKQPTPSAPVEEVVNTEIEVNEFQEYPGWDWDPVKGWVRIDDGRN